MIILNRFLSHQNSQSHHKICITRVPTYAGFTV